MHPSNAASRGRRALSASETSCGSAGRQEPPPSRSQTHSSRSPYGLVLTSCCSPPPNEYGPTTCQSRYVTSSLPTPVVRLGSDTLRNTPYGVPSSRSVTDQALDVKPTQPSNRLSSHMLLGRSPPPKPYASSLSDAKTHFGPSSWCRRCLSPRRPTRVQAPDASPVSHQRPAARLAPKSCFSPSLAAASIMTACHASASPDACSPDTPVLS